MMHQMLSPLVLETSHLYSNHFDAMAAAGQARQTNLEDALKKLRHVNGIAATEAARGADLERWWYAFVITLSAWFNVVVVAMIVSTTQSYDCIYS